MWFNVVNATVKWVPVVLGLGGIAIETIADAQKSRFRYVSRQHSMPYRRALCCAALRCAVLCCAVLCCAVLCCAVVDW